MSEKQAEAPPSYAEASLTSSGTVNPGYVPPTTDNRGFSVPPPQGFSQNQYGMQQGMYSGQNTVVLGQPAPMAQYTTVEVPDHMGLAMFATFCCCWPVGIFAIGKANESRAALGRNDIQTALAAAAEAKRYSHIAIAAGSVTLVVAIIVLVVVLVQLNTFY